MAINLEMSSSSMEASARFKSNVDESRLHTVHDFGINYDKYVSGDLTADDLKRGGGRVCVYIGGQPKMLTVRGREPIFDDTRQLKGMSWYVPGDEQIGEPHNGFEPNERVIKGIKHPILYEKAATLGEEVFLMENDQYLLNDKNDISSGENQ